MRTPLIITLSLALTAGSVEAVYAKDPAPVRHIKSFFKKLTKPYKAKKSYKKKTTSKKVATKASGSKSKTNQQAPVSNNTVAAKQAAKKTTSKTATLASKPQPTKKQPVSTKTKAVVATTATTATAAAVATTATKPEEPKQKPAMVSSLDPQDIVEYEQQPEKIQKLISSALAMTKMDLTYTYGSNNPKNGGMDCSGAIQYLLRKQGFRQTPRQANLIHAWSDKNGTLIPAKVHKLNAPELDALKPGDLLYWSGTYKIDRHITHVMMYLGTDKKTKKPVMFGASDGRPYNGKRRRGVSVFEFRLPKPEKKSKFEGYGPIPGMFNNTAEAGALKRS